MAILSGKIFNNLRKKNRDKGFTLTELLVVLGIVAILLVIWFTSRWNQIAKARDAKRKADLNKMQIVLEDYLDDNLRYPEELPCGSTDKTELEDYLAEVPCDPLNRGDYDYRYQTDEDGGWYKIFTFLEDEDDSDIEELGCQEGCGPGDSFNYYVSSPNVVICKPPYEPADCSDALGNEICYPENPCICCPSNYVCLPQGDCCRQRKAGECE